MFAGYADQLRGNFVALESTRDKSAVARVGHAWTVLRHDPTKAIAVIVGLLLAYLVIGPIVSILLDTVRLHPGDALQLGATSGDWTTFYLDRTFASSVSATKFWLPLLRTLFVGIAAAFLAIALGLAMAWLVVGTNIRGRKALGSLLVIPYMLPSWTFGSAWITVFKNRKQGGSPGFMETLGWTPPDWVAYGPFPMILTLAMSYFPFAFLLYSNALRGIDNRLEEAARILGASRAQIFRKVIFPLLLPSTMSAVLLTLARTLGTFGTPYLLGKPVNYTLLSTSLYAEMKTGSAGVASVIACILALIGMAMMLMDIQFAKQWRRFVTIGGKGGARVLSSLRGASRALNTGMAWAVFVIIAVLPTTVLLLSTVMRVPGRFELSNFTSQFWLANSISSAPGESGVLRSASVLSAAGNSLWIAGIAAIICGTLGLIVGYLVMRLPRSFMSAYLRQVSFLPYLIPGLAFSAAFLTLFAVRRGPIPSLYGTPILLVLVMIVVYLPYASRSGISAMTQQGYEPEEAAMVLGAPFWRRITKIVVPLQKGALITGILLPFITGMKELSLVVMLVTPGTAVLTTESVRLLDYGHTQLANAVILIVGVVVLITTTLVQRITGSTLADSIGS